MQRLAEFEEYEVGYIDQVVVRIESCGTQIVLHPFGRRADLAVGDRKARVARACLAVLDAYLDRHVVVVDRKSIDTRHLQRDVLAAAAQICRQIACHTYMRCRIYAVRRKAYTDQVVVLYIEIFARRSADNGIVRELHYTGMIRTDAELVFGAKHAERLDAANLASFDLELFFAAVGVEDSPDRSAHDFQTGAAIGGSADYLQRLPATDIDRCDVQVVAVGVVDTSQHLTDHHAGQTAAYGFHLLETLDFESYISKNNRNLFGRQIGVDVIFEPVVRNVHIVGIYNFQKTYKDTYFAKTIK